VDSGHPSNGPRSAPPGHRGQRRNPSRAGAHVLALMRTGGRTGHHHAMTRRAALTWWSWSAPAAFLLGRAVTVAAGPAVVPPGELLTITALLLPSVVTGVLVALRVPDSPVGGALAWVGAAPAVVFAVEDWGRTAASDRPWPGSRFAAGLVEATWPWLFLGFVALVLVFPDGLLPGRRWRVLAALAPVSAAVLTTAIALNEGNFAGAGGPWPGPPRSCCPHR
jgi:hypothetical protein